MWLYVGEKKVATIIYAPIISEARGKVADAVFSVWKGRPYIRQRVIPANPQTPAQDTVRESLARCVELWQSLELQITDVQDTYATGYRMSGFNWFMQQNRKQEETTAELKIAPPNKLIDPVTTLAGVAGANAGEINLTWLDGTESAGHKIYVIVRKTLTNEFEVKSHDAVLTSAHAVTLTGLVPATLYGIYLCDELVATHQFSASDFCTATSHA